MDLWTFWLILAVAFFIIELFTTSTTCLYIGLGALAGMLAALSGGGWTACILTFVVCTVVIYIATYHWRKRLIAYLHKDTPDTPTGMDALIGRTGKVIAAQDSLRIRIDGDVWQIEPDCHTIDLHQGDNVRVTGYNSIILTVEPVRN